MRISDWSSDVCSSDLRAYDVVGRSHPLTIVGRQNIIPVDHPDMVAVNAILGLELPIAIISICLRPGDDLDLAVGIRSEEHTSELQSLMRISYAVFCLKKKNNEYKLL